LQFIYPAREAKLEPTPYSCAKWGIDEEMNRMDNGEFITHDEVVKTSQSWLNGKLIYI
jgi:hypothetical protein